MIFRSTAGFLLGCAACSLGNPLPIDPSVFSKPMAVLDLVNLRDSLPDSAAAEGLRHSLERGRFHVLSRDETEKKLEDFGASLSQRCDNTQCSFDAGGYLQADFVLYGTYSPIEKIRAVTLKLLYVPTARIVWTWVGELPVLDGVEALAGDSDEWQRPTEALAETARDGALEFRPRGDSKSLAVIDVSENFYSSRIISERVQTHMNGLTHYQPMSASELSELLGALSINKYALGPSSRNMLGLGQKLGASALLYARAYRDGNSYLCRLAFYDIDRRAVILDFPPKPTRDFGELLEYENDFFATLYSREKELEHWKPENSNKHGSAKNAAAVPPEWASAPSSSGLDSTERMEKRPNIALWITLGLLGIGGGLTAFWLESLKKK